MSLLRSFCTPYGAPGRLYYDSYEFFKCGPQADLRAWRKLAVTFFAQQIQIENSLGWFLTLWTTHSCKNQLVANFSADILHYSLTTTFVLTFKNGKIVVFITVELAHSAANPTAQSYEDKSF